MSETITNPIEKPSTNRRQMLTRAGIFGAMALGSGMLNVGKAEQADAALSVTYPMGKKKFKVDDVDILNFALNLEYLEAEYYQRAAFGAPLGESDTGLAATKCCRWGPWCRLPFPPFSNMPRRLRPTS